MFTVSGQPVFVVGSPRSGGVLMQRVLCAHSQMWGGPRSDFLVPLLDGLEQAHALGTSRGDLHWLSRLEVTPDEVLQSVGLGVNALYTNRSAGRAWVDQTPQYTLHLSQLRRMFPSARFVFMVRDGRDVTHSLRQSEPPVPHEGAARRWKVFTEAGLEWIESTADHQMLVIRHESLMAEPRREVRRVLDFLEVSIETACVDIAARQGRSDTGPAESGRADGWEGWVSGEREAFDAVGGDLLIHLGYEADRSWLSSEMDAAPAHRAFDEAAEAAAVDLRYLDGLIHHGEQRATGPLLDKTELVFSPGKAGSSSLRRAILAELVKQHGAPRAIEISLHTHNNRVLAEHLAHHGGAPFSPVGGRSLIADLVEYQHRRHRRLRIVTSSRDPIARAISLVFQWVDRIVTDSGIEELNRMSHATLHEKVAELLGRRGPEAHPLEEIDTDFFVKHVFDHETKSCHVDEGHYEVLALCLEHSDRWEEALRQLTGLGQLRIRKENATINKAVGLRYEEFRSELRLPVDLIGRVYADDGPFSSTLQWFYTWDEREAFRADALSRYGS